MHWGVSSQSASSRYPGVVDFKMDCNTTKTRLNHQWPNLSEKLMKQAFSKFPPTSSKARQGILPLRGLHITLCRPKPQAPPVTHKSWGLEQPSFALVLRGNSSRFLRDHCTSWFVLINAILTKISKTAPLRFQPAKSPVAATRGKRGPRRTQMGWCQAQEGLTLH